MNSSAFFFAVASILLVSTWLLYFLLLHDPVIQWLVYAGWVILAVGLVFIFLAMAALRSKGRPEKDKDFTHTTTFVDRGIYAIVRHPLYLGWLLMYVAVIFFSQHGLILILGILGVLCIRLISRQEDLLLIEKFGDRYKSYINVVPAMNALLGMVRFLRSR